MWIQKNKAGHYQFFERYTDTDGKRRVISVTYPKKNPQYQQLATDTLRERIKKATVPASQVLTLQELADRYSDWKYANLKEQTAQNSKGRIQVIVDLIGPDTLVSSITPADYAALTDAPAGTYNERLIRFKAMYRWAFKNDLVEDLSLLKKLDPKKDVPHRVKISDKFLEKEELKTLINGLIPKYALVSEFLALTGMRVSELIDLKKDHVDLEARTITIDSTYALLTGKSSSTKTEMSNRTIYIQEELMDCISRIQTFTGVIKSNYFFPTESGYHLDYDAYRMHLARRAPKLIGRKITPHIFRHTHTSLLAEAGIPLEQISRRLGHADSKVTREVYLHVTQRMIEKENERLDKIKLL